MRDLLKYVFIVWVLVLGFVSIINRAIVTSRLFYLQVIKHEQFIRYRVTPDMLRPCEGPNSLRNFCILRKVTVPKVPEVQSV